MTRMHLAQIVAFCRMVSWYSRSILVVISRLRMACNNDISAGSLSRTRCFVNQARARSRRPRWKRAARVSQSGNKSAANRFFGTFTIRFQKGKVIINRAHLPNDVTPAIRPLRAWSRPFSPLDSCVLFIAFSLPSSDTLN